MAQLHSRSSPVRGLHPPASWVVATRRPGRRGRAGCPDAVAGVRQAALRGPGPLPQAFLRYLPARGPARVGLPQASAARHWLGRGRQTPARVKAIGCAPCGVLFCAPPRQNACSHAAGCHAPAECRSQKVVSRPARALRCRCRPSRPRRSRYLPTATPGRPCPHAIQPRHLP